MLPLSVPPSWGVQGPVEVWGNTLITKDNAITPHGVCLASAIIALLFFWALYKSSRVWTPLLLPSVYPKLKLHDKRDWDVRWGNMVYPPLVVALAVLDKLWPQQVWHTEAATTQTYKMTSDWSYAALGISVGFFIVDLSVVFKYHLGGVEMLAHHAMSCFSFVWGIYTGECHVLAMTLLMTEITTPFITMRWWLDKSEMKSGRMYFWNGLSILATWFLFRVVLFVPLFLTVYKCRHEVKDLTYISQFLLLIVPPGLMGLNIFWFAKIVRGAMKLVSKPKAKKL